MSTEAIILLLDETWTHVLLEFSLVDLLFATQCWPTNTVTKNRRPTILWTDLAVRNLQLQANFLAFQGPRGPGAFKALNPPLFTSMAEKRPNLSHFIAKGLKMPDATFFTTYQWYKMKSVVQLPLVNQSKSVYRLLHIPERQRLTIINTSPKQYNNKPKTRSPAVAMVGQPYRSYPKASVWLSVAERKWFPKLTTIPIPYTLWWRCYIERYNQR